MPHGDDESFKFLVASGPVATLEEVMAIDAAARRTARALVAKRAA